ncbi:Copper resistance protein K [Cupriavidus necator]|uniref:Copper resistance protein K n=1 Tax=Cupriavidus necator TaxID=106590 RepID=A0A1K0IC83_CUPNE|nr:Copper resistance protein K [Cupriavidus necator]
MKSKLAVATLIGALSFTASAVDQSNVVKTYELKDGSKVHVFKDGKMGMENKFGRAVNMPKGKVMETKDGDKILMKGNEVFRLDDALIKGHREGG